MTQDLLPDDTAAALQDLGPRRITVMGGDAAVGAAVEEQLDAHLVD